MRTLQKRLFGVILAAASSVALLPSASQASVDLSISVNVGPPVLPVYVQPAIPAPGYIWTPGYWAWDGDDYYWVPGTWVRPPRVGYLWTPPYWGWSDGVYVFHPGYWGMHVGFYGGVAYGFGYTGSGYAGGYWSGSQFYYNRSVNNVVNVTNVYNKTVIVNHVSTVSYNGGPGGTVARPTSLELAAAHESHIAYTGEQLRHEKAARSEPTLHAHFNGGHPAIAATVKPGALHAASLAPRETSSSRAAAENHMAARSEHGDRDGDRSNKRHASARDISGRSEQDRSYAGAESRRSSESLYERPRLTHAARTEPRHATEHAAAHRPDRRHQPAE